ncbi:MAG: zf-HC2 domain-containing protein [Pseudonocardiales bacterium]
MSTVDPFTYDDGPYVLGTLAADERAAFEQHLVTCEACTERVRELAPLPALLAPVPASAYSDAVEDPPATLLPGLLHRARFERRRRRRLTSAVAGLAAACLVALAVAVWPPSHSQPPAPRPQAMTALFDTPVQATAVLTSVSWGTKIDLVCHYYASGTPGVDYTLVVLDKHNVAHEAGSWKLVPGKDIHFPGGVSLRRDEIAKVEITVHDRAILQLTL